MNNIIISPASVINCEKQRIIIVFFLVGSKPESISKIVIIVVVCQGYWSLIFIIANILHKKYKLGFVIIEY